MGMVPERSKPLHNFSLPCLKWGSQKFLRCVNAPSNIITTINNNSNNNNPSQPSSSSPDRRSSRLQSKPQIEPSRLPKRKSNQNFDGVPGKKLKVSNFEDGGGGEEGGGANGGGGGGGASNRPWNLRTRRAACKAPAPPSASPQAQALSAPHDEDGNKLFDVGGSSSHYQVKDKKVMMMMNERSKFSVSLSKEEVEQDFWGLVGTRPPRRPKKRPRIVQRQLDTLFPGLWLTEVNADCYKVAEVPE
ncbi:hypothetical protein PIB30_030757 [Stylosanthes scabra]|uniref:DUF1639 family protein n=1 Tax=Stylosanthes scabra TaxID=79078 RepID=A0ABU6XD69_9FABA|nr:hypothetical protein [Stylosanthes scabra]